jgi:hypothetical protein
VAEKEEAVKQVRITSLRYSKELMLRRFQRSMAFRGETCCAGRRMDVKGRRAGDVPLTPRCN